MQNSYSNPMLTITYNIPQSRSMLKWLILDAVFCCKITNIVLNRSECLWKKAIGIIILIASSLHNYTLLSIIINNYVFVYNSMLWVECVTLSYVIYGYICRYKYLNITLYILENLRWIEIVSEAKKRISASCIVLHESVLHVHTSWPARRWRSPG